MYHFNNYIITNFSFAFNSSSKAIFDGTLSGLCSATFLRINVFPSIPCLNNLNINETDKHSNFFPSYGPR